MGTAAVLAKAASDIKNQTNSSIGEYALAGVVGTTMGAMAGLAIVAAPYTAEALAFKSIMTIPSSMLTPAMIPIINGGASFLTYGLGFSNLMFRYFDVMEFAIGQNDLKVLLCEILGSENGLSTYNALDFLTFLASLQMIMSEIVVKLKSG